MPVDRWAVRAGLECVSTPVHLHIWYLLSGVKFSERNPKALILVFTTKKPPQNEADDLDEKNCELASSITRMLCTRSLIFFIHPL